MIFQHQIKRNGRRNRCSSGVAWVLAALCILAAFPKPLTGQNETRQYVVQLRSPSVVSQMRNQFTPAGARMLRADAAARYRGRLLDEQAEIRRSMESLPRAKVRHQMDTVFNGFGVVLRPEDVEAVRRLPGVAQVYPSVEYHKTLDAALGLVHVPAGWIHPSIGGEESAGTGIKIGVVDTGIDMNHPMFLDTSLIVPSGFPKFTEPTPDCANSDERFTNSKVIVARNYVHLLSRVDPNCDAEDRDGHGSFSASVAAGRRVAAPLASIAGVAPKAFLGSYKVFGTPGLNDAATLGAIIAALDGAVKDGMDIINLSLGAAIDLPPSLDPLVLAVKEAVEAGVVVVVAAGNAGPGTGTITSPGTAPEAITVGSTTNSRVLALPFLITAPAPVPEELALIAATPGNGPEFGGSLGPLPLMDVTEVDLNGTACDLLPAGSLAGSITLIRRGGCSFQTKINNVAGAGAVAAILFHHLLNQPATPIDVGNAQAIPSAMIGNSDGVLLRDFLATAGGTAQASLGGVRQAIPAGPNRMTGFSSVGPSTDFGIKPDLVAPGTNIYGATQSRHPSGVQFRSTGYDISSGTSVSTPAQVKSVLMHTAATNVVPLGDGVAGVLSSGGGLLDVEAALQSPAIVFVGSISLGSSLSFFNPIAFMFVEMTNLGTITDTFLWRIVPAEGSGTVQMEFFPPNPTLLAGETQMVGISIQGSESVEGWVEIESLQTGRVLHVPYWGNALHPAVNSGGVVNAASLTPGPTELAPGSLISIFGTEMAGSAASAGVLPLPEALAGARVTINGVSAPLLFVSPNQINAQIPYELAGASVGAVEVRYSGVGSTSVTFPMATAAPGIFSADQSGAGRGAVLHAGTSQAVNQANPARPGEFIEVFVSGLGFTLPGATTGQPAPADPLLTTLLPTTATLGGAPAQVTFSGLAPHFVGLYQVNVQVPENAATGALPLVISNNGVASNTVTVDILP